MSDNDGFVFYRKPQESEYFLDVEKYAKSIKWKTQRSIGRYTVKKLQATIVLSRSKSIRNTVEKIFFTITPKLSSIRSLLGRRFNKKRLFVFV